MSPRHCTHKATGSKAHWSCALLSLWEHRYSAQISALPSLVGNQSVLVHPKAHSGRATPTVSTLRMKMPWQSHAPPFMHMLTMRLLWKTQSPFCAQPSCGPDHSPGPSNCLCIAKLSLFPRSVHWNPATVHTTRHASQAGKGNDVARAVYDGLSLPCMSQAGSCTLLWDSKAPYLSWLTSQPVKEVPRVREPFLFHSSFPSM